MPQEKNPKRSDDALERLSDLQRLGQVLFEREAGRLARKHGLDHPRAQRFIRAARGAQDMLTALEVTRDAAPQDVRVDQDEAAVYGRVATSDLRSVANVEVALEDTSGRVMRAAGTATTDASGRYRLRIPSGVATKLAGKEYIITVRSAKGDVLYRSDAPLQLTLGQAIQVDINLGQRAPVRRPAAQPRPTPPNDERPDAPLRPRRPRKPKESVTYSVSGQVVSSDGKPVPGVLVRIYDKDRTFDDLLGAALTNRQGAFATRYRFQDFSEGETAADLFFVVLDADEHELLSTVDQVKFNAEHETTVTLTLPG